MKASEQALVIRFHLFLHFLENQLDFGVTSNVDTGPIEDNHKFDAKKASGQTQGCADTFELQTSHCYINNLIWTKPSQRWRNLFLQASLQSSIVVAAPVKGGLGKRQALSKVAVENNTTNNQDCMMNTSINSTKYKHLWVIIVGRT
jgi:hypothetical protein